MTEQPLEMFVWTVFFAILAAVLYSLVVKGVLSGLIRRLERTKAETRESAKTLAALGYKNGLIKSLTATLAKGGSPLARALEIDEPAPDINKPDLLFAEKTEAAYYLPPENRTKSFEKHYAERVPLVKTVGLIVLLALVAFAASSVIRFFGNWTNSLLRSDSKNHAYGTTERDDSLLNEQEKLNDEEKRRAEEEKEENRASEADADSETPESPDNSDIGNDAENS